jgi:hypothetical protein
VTALAQKLKSRNVTFVERYLAAPSEKALAKATGSDYFHMAWGHKTAELAREAALAGCQKRKPEEPCTIVMENDRWIGPETADRSVIPNAAAGAEERGNP